jgi:glycosyltransferase involved in cell wall biosynthesis
MPKKLNLSKDEIKGIIKTKDVLVALITKNVSKHIPKVLKNAMTYASYFKSSKYLIIDGHSTDGTYEICRSWCKGENRKLYRQPSSFLPRPLALSEARNMYISLFQEDFKKDTYLIMMDCDEVNTCPVDEEGFLSNFDYSLNEWDAMFVNQTKEYYDIYALRNDECPENYQEVLRRTGDEWNSLKKHQIPKPRSHPIISVKSAFGGIGLYHTEKLKECWYSSFIGNPFDGRGCKEVCEHVPFHEALLNKDGKLFINPNFINM